MHSLLTQHGFGWCKSVLWWLR